MKIEGSDIQLGETVEYSQGTKATGLVTGVLFREGQTLFLITWGHDMTERTHYRCELRSPAELREAAERLKHLNG